MSAGREAVAAHEATLKARAAEPLARLSARHLDDSVLAEILARGGILHEERTEDGRTVHGWTPQSGRQGLAARLCYSEGVWRMWDGTVWLSKGEADAVEVVRRELRARFTELTASPDLKPDDVKAYAVLLQKTKAANVLYFLRGLLAVDAAKFDADPYVLNCRNGLVDLRDASIRAPHPEDYLTKVTGCDYDPEATHPDWEMALEALPSDVREWMQVRYGQAITGFAVDDDVIPIQTGDGSNGKSAQVTAMVKALGGYGVFVPDRVLLASPGEHPADLMTLRGARFAVLEETPEGKFLPTKRLKDLAGTAVMTARAMRQDWVSWDATHTLFVNTNFVPQIAETDGGTWRRLALVRYPYKFIHPDDPIMAPNERHGDPGLRERLRDNPGGQWDAVLAWLVAGAVEWFGNGRRQLPVPLTVRLDTQRWREDTDVVMAYCMERIEFDPSSKVLTSDLYEDFLDWMQGVGKTKVAENTLAARLESHELFKKNNVAKLSRSRDHSGLTRLPVSWREDQKPTPAQATMWAGVRFKPRESVTEGGWA
ncbi:phage/plasmid primase, P4 family [Microbacterium sp. SMR1]|uniref:DNA primase family protein n=1 Tax=Microbacterium sp. SMR1 TaxID=1497340 RepID=UPI0015EC8C38|nr:phage/plasmid primase, P4 family [Microbacterium sp. SMR1]